jgi:hypothetical protein
MMEVRIPAVVVAIQFDQHIDAPDKRVGAVHDHHFLMERLDGVMQDAAGAIIEQAGHADLRELLLCRLGITMGKVFITSPDQDFHIDSFAHQIAQDCLDGQCV